VFGTAPTISLPVIDNIKLGYTTTATAAGTTTLTSASNRQQLFTGSTTQTIALPVTSTLTAGMSYEVENNSTGNLTVNSSGGNLVATVLPGTTAHILCIGTTLTTAADWDADFIAFSTLTGTGANVLATSPTLTTPSLGVATATSINKMAITAPATGSTLAVADGKTFTVSNTITFVGTDSTTFTLPGTSGSLALTGYPNSSTSLPNGGDLMSGEAFAGATVPVDAFGIAIIPTYSLMDPVGSTVTLDLN
jgi:hypothetical protein